MAKIDKDLVGALKQAKTKTMFFALVEKTPGEGTLIVSRNPIPQSAIGDAQKDLGGGGKIFKGHCSTNPTTGELVFETDTEPPAVRTLKAVISRDAGLNLKVSSQKAKAGVTIQDILGAVDDDRKEQDEKRLDDITGGDAFKKSKALGGIVADALNKQVENVKRLIDSKDFKKAEQALDELKKLAENPTEDL
jgi:hypothetical protein